jgi:hypothetical protein
VLKQSIGEGALDEVRIYFPDPWHKKRHHKRRLVQPAFRRAAGQPARPGGLLHLATDWQPYAEQMWEVLDASPHFATAPARAARSAPGLAPETHFERAACASDTGSGTCSTAGSDGEQATHVPRNPARCAAWWERLMFAAHHRHVAGAGPGGLHHGHVRVGARAPGRDRPAGAGLLGLFGLVPVDQLFDGFAGNAVISVIATMILGAGLDRTGALNRWRSGCCASRAAYEERLVLLTSAVAGLVSSVMQNPAVTALFLPVASRLSARTGVSLGGCCCRSPSAW